MNIAHLHLLTNHIPILGSIFITILFAIALIYKNVFMQKVSLWFLVVIALITPVAYFSGDQSVSAVEVLPGFSQPLLQSHAQIARIGLLLMFVAGIVALGGVLRYRKKPALPHIYNLLILLILLISTAVFAYVGYLGGQVNHPEIRSLLITTYL